MKFPHWGLRNETLIFCPGIMDSSLYPLLRAMSHPYRLLLEVGMPSLVAVSFKAAVAKAKFYCGVKTTYLKE